MTRQNRGLPLLFYDDERPFSLDRQGLSKLFDKLNFDTLKVREVKGSPVDWNEYIPRSSHAQPQDCFVLFIMSSHRNGYLNKKRTIEEILNTVKSRTDLVKIPKLIFHITRNTEAPAASGATPCADDVNNDVGTAAAPIDEVKEQPGDPVKDLNLKTPHPMPEQRDQDTAICGSGGDEVDAPSESEHVSIPKDSDFFYIRSTDYGSATLGSGENRCTRIIYLLVFYFAKYAHSHEFYKLMSLLNTTHGHDETTVVKFEKDTGGKSLYFFPGCFSAESQ